MQQSDAQAILFIFGVIVLGLGSLIMSEKKPKRKYWYVMFIAAAILALPAFCTLIITAIAG